MVSFNVCLLIVHVHVLTSFCKLLSVTWINKLLYCTVLYQVYCIVFYCIVLNCIVLYCIVLYQ